MKLRPDGLVGKERTAFEKVEAILGPAAPSVRGFVDFGARAGLLYSYAAMGRGRIRSLKSLFDDSAPIATILDALATVTDEIFAPFFAAARYERLPLFQQYGFARAEVTPYGPRLVPNLRWNAAVRARVEAILGGPAGAEIHLPGGGHGWNPCRFYEEFLPLAHFPQSDAHYAATVHGDLNGANALIDPRGNVWVIDFFHTGPNHVLRDLIQLEKDLLYLWTPLEDEDALTEALRITAALRRVEDLRAPLPESIDGVERPALQRAWSVIRFLRSVAARVGVEDRHPRQVSVGLLRYAVHSLSFDEAAPLQTRWALAAASGLAEDLVRHFEAERLLRAGWRGRAVACQTASAS